VKTSQSVCFVDKAPGYSLSSHILNNECVVAYAKMFLHGFVLLLELVRMINATFVQSPMLREWTRLFLVEWWSCLHNPKSAGNLSLDCRPWILLQFSCRSSRSPRHFPTAVVTQLHCLLSELPPPHGNSSAANRDAWMQIVSTSSSDPEAFNCNQTVIQRLLEFAEVSSNWYQGFSLQDFFNTRTALRWSQFWHRQR